VITPSAARGGTGRCAVTAARSGTLPVRGHAAVSEAIAAITNVGIGQADAPDRDREPDTQLAQPRRRAG
jgi:hypothetical protein